MAFDWGSLFLTIAIGFGGGLISGIGTLLISRFRLKGKIKKELHKAGIKVEFKDCDCCDGIIPVDATFCLECGKPIEGDKQCEKCGTYLPSEALYCYLCDGRATLREINKNKDKSKKVD